MNIDGETALPRFRRPPLSEVAIGIQFQSPVLNAVHFGLFYQKIKERYPTMDVRFPLQHVTESFDEPPAMMLPAPPDIMQQRVLFGSADGYTNSSGF